MTIASRFVQAAKTEHKVNPHNVHGFLNDVRFAASERFNNYEKNQTEYLFKDKSVLAISFIPNFREDGEIKSIQMKGLNSIKEIPNEGLGLMLKKWH